MPSLKQGILGWVTTNSADPIRIRALVESFRSAEDPYWINPQEEVRAHSRRFHNEIVDRIRGALWDIDAFAMRWVERAWEIALNLHVGLHGIECYRQLLSKETFANAVSISSYFAERQLEVLNAMRVKALNDGAVLELITVMEFGVVRGLGRPGSRRPPC